MTTTTTAIDDLLATVCGDHGGRPWAPDVEFDAVVPGWRLSLTGAAAVADQFRAWFAHPGTLEEVRRQPTPSGEVIEFSVSWVEDGVPFAARHVHLLDIDASGLITRIDLWCGGRWPAQLLAQMEAVRHAG